ncbi:hypothetical protein [Mucilaginibacter flavus]|uniref:hypothetical protein n=1 Tax=Mucilaginibacter flavus TaxID=931504 RepID=UPI0025B3FDB1|nr:hypothetical protein [Mucilaginibacter flavus]MDN3583068.1 hypothetical protein [Mucilaginibacter flavus]
MSLINLSIKDETAGGKILNEIIISLENELVTIRDIIEARVNAEVEAYNKKQPQIYHGLVQPTEAELTLNGSKIKSLKKIDAEKQVYIALAAFQQNGFFVLIDNQQAESLEENVILTNKSTVSFIKLTPLIGG